MTNQAEHTNSVLAQQGGFRLSVGADSNKGHRRQNEDSLAFYSIGTAQIAVIADGMGGGLDGKLFSQLAINSIRKYLTGHGAGDARQQLEEALQKTADDLHEFRNSRPDYRGSGTTIVVAWIEATSEGGRAIIANIGDSRAYLIKAQGNISQVTRDHTYGERLIDEGLSEEQAYQDHQAARLTYALGEQLDVHQIPECFSEVILDPGDRLLLCTDGVCKPVPPEELAMLASKSPPQEATGQLLKRALARGSRDNVSALLVHYLPAVRAAVAAGSPTMPKWTWVLGVIGVICILAAGALLGRNFFGSANADSSPAGAATITPLPPSPSQEIAATAEKPVLGATSTVGTAIATSTLTPSPTETATNTPIPTNSPRPATRQSNQDSSDIQNQPGMQAATATPEAPEAATATPEAPEAPEAATATPDTPEAATATPDTPAPSEEPSAEQAPIEEPSAEQAPVAQPSAEQAPVAQPSAEQAPIEEPSTEQAPIEEPSTEQAPVAQPSAEQAPVAQPSAEQPSDNPGGGT